MHSLRRLAKILFAVFLTTTSMTGHASGPFSEEELAVEPGQLIYQTYCISCHATPDARAPRPSVLRMMSADHVLDALNKGVMKNQGQLLSVEEKQAVAEYLTNKQLGSKLREVNLPLCGDPAFDAARQVTPRDWGFDFNNTRSQTLKQAGLNPGELEHLKLAWAIVLPDALQLRSQPTFAGGWLYMGSQDGTVYALDAKSGCIHWTFHASAEVRTTISLTEWKEGDVDPQPVAIFGDHLGNVYGVRARTGELLWKRRPHKHVNATVTGSPRVIGDVAYVPFASHEDISASRPDYECCTFRGAVAKLNAHTGEVIWMGYSVEQPATRQKKNSVGTQLYGTSGASIWNSPALDFERGQLYVGTGDNYSGPAGPTSDAVIAFDLDTGRQNWVYQATPGGDVWNNACLANVRGPNCPEDEGPDYDIGTGMILTHSKAGKPLILAGQKSGDAFALDPETGEEIWRIQLGRGGIQGGIHFGMAASGGVGYIPVSDMVYENDAATYDREPNPGLFAVDLSNGQVMWRWLPEESTCRGREFCDPGISAPPTVIGDHLLVGGLDGVLRIHDRKTGRVVWSMDTTTVIKGINGYEGAGGS
ncbi:MAG: PQQ-binding-like beta-propeller repeat protein, partial [Gammaproteobacteria bacterium]|nr:PQQ-binding-like beta-propeller repeat protein [Gammaproteobacteria bacterium]